MTAIEKLKATAHDESLLLMLSNPDAKLVAVGWEHYHPAFEDFDVPEDASVSQVLGQAWERVTVDYELLAQLSLVGERIAEWVFPMLQNAQIVFPDGSISDLARRVLRAEVAGFVKKAAGE